MADLYQQERLQPSLLDRLTDDFTVRKPKHYSTTKNEADPSRLDSHTSEPASDDIKSPEAAAAESATANPKADQTSGSPSSSATRTQASAQKESADRLIITSRKLRECVKRDLSWLLNTGSLDDVVDLTEYPLTAQSVLNYGIPDLTGVTVANLDERELERRIKRVIIQFEPRILKETLRVKVIKVAEMSHSALQFEIECDIWGQPAPEHLYLNSELDLGTGSIEFVDRHGG